MSMGHIKKKTPDSSSIRGLFKSGRRDSNPRPSAWKANALSTELLPHVASGLSRRRAGRVAVWLPRQLALCGRRWIRTTEGINQQIYSLPHLATLVFARYICERYSLNFEPLVGFEPTTPRLQITCSGQLS